MEIVLSFVVAAALSLDAFSVAVSIGSALRQVQRWQALMLGVYFGGFQAGMTLLGWYGGTLLEAAIQDYDHWVACAVLAAVGGKMIWESRAGESEKTFTFSHRLLALLALVTSIDALGIGLSYSLIERPILPNAALIGIVAFGLSYFGVYLGRSLRGLCRNKIELAGGLVLIAIGLQIAIEHEFF